MYLNFKNRKIQILLLLFVSCALSYATNVDDLISQYEKNSYTTKINAVSLKKYDIKDKALKMLIITNYTIKNAIVKPL